MLLYFTKNVIVLMKIYRNIRKGTNKILFLITLEIVAL